MRERLNLRNLFLENLTSKIFSVLVAVVLWVFVMGEKKAELALRVPLEVVGIPPGSIVVNDVPNHLEVKVMGPRTLLRNLVDRGIKKEIDLTNTEVGWTTFRILPDSISFPRGVEVTKVSPSSIDVKLDTLAKGTFPVRLAIKGKPPEGFRLAGIQISPKTISLKGARGDLRNLKELVAGPLDISHLKATIQKEVPIDFSNLHLVEKSTDKLKVSVRIEPEIEQKSFKNIPIRVANPPAGFKLSPPSVEVVVYGPKNAVTALKKRDIEIKVDLKGLAPGIHTRRYAVRLPPGILLKEIRPKSAEVEITKK